MAKASENSSEAAASPKSNKLRNALILGGVVAVASAGGFLTPYMLQQKTSHAEAAHAEQVETKPEFVSFGEAVVNLDAGRLNRYLRVRIALQISEPDLAPVNAAVEKNRVILRNWLISYLSDRKLEDIRGASGQNRLRREIRNQFNSTLFSDGPQRIQDVLFEEFNVQ